MSQATSTYYDILGVDRNADSSTIRKAYLKLSLKHHPDKNPDQVEEAKAKFVVIGQAYETLSDPEERAIYDRELRSGAFRPSGSGSGGSGSTPATNTAAGQSKSYDNYSDAFDATVAGMSEAELAAAVGAAAAFAGVVGSIVGSHMMRGNGNKSRGGGGSSFLGTAGSIVGSMVASEMAASSVRALHQQSIQKIAYKEECRRAVERGDRLPDPPPASKWEEVIQKTVNAVNAVKGTTTPQNNDNQQSNTNNTRSSPMGDMWNMARAGVQAAANQFDAKNSTTPNNTYRR